jgi:hypothetical protein
MAGAGAGSQSPFRLLPAISPWVSGHQTAGLRWPGRGQAVLAKPRPGPSCSRLAHSLI